jgi:hypothetical protein
MLSAVARARTDDGSALLLVVGATAALCALALATLSVAMLAYEIAVLEHRGVAARLLSRSALDLTAGELASGRLAVPPPSGQSVWEPALPPPPSGAPALPRGCGFRVLLSRVEAVAPPTSAVPPLLVDAVAEARCGRGFDRRRARYAVDAVGAVKRLY